jgi:hypothetical protein
MTWHDHARRAGSVLLVILCLLAVPAVAEARFSSGRSAALVASTDRMETPAGVTGSYWCAFPFITEGIDVSVTGFADAGPVGATYDYTLTGRGVTKTTSSAAHSASLTSGGVVNDRKATTWTLTITSRLGSWTGTPYTRTISCPASWGSSGSL